MKFNINSFIINDVLKAQKKMLKKLNKEKKKSKSEKNASKTKKEQKDGTLYIDISL